MRTARRCRILPVERGLAAGPSHIAPRCPQRRNLFSNPSRHITSTDYLSQRGTHIVPYRTSVTNTETGASSFTSPAIPEIPHEDTFNIIIIGGGNAGLALACSLLSKPTIRETTRILLLEGGSLDRPHSWTGQEEWDNRVSSLTAENVGWLESIGAWEHIDASRSCPVNEMIVWANPTPSSAPTLHFPPLNHPMARMTENINLQRALLRRIKSAGQGVVEIREDSRVGEMRLGQGGQWVGLRIGDEKWVRGAVVVGADGPQSPVRRFSDIGTYGYPYPTHAVVATLHHPRPSQYPNNTAFQRFLPTGPLAFLPLSPTASTMVWSTRPDHAAAYKRLSPEALVTIVNAGYTAQEDVLAALNEQVLTGPVSAGEITDFLAAHTPDSPYSPNQPILPPTVTSIPRHSIASFPLRLSHADSYLGNRTVLVGDAAHTIHPLAGQGLNMGLADVRCLANLWESVRRTGGDLGARTNLLDYAKERYPANQLMLTTTDMFHRVFGSRGPAINWLRGTGLDVLNELGPIKKVLMGGAGAAPKEYTPINPMSERIGRSSGWPMAAASALEGWLGLKQVVGLAAGVAGEAAKNGLRRTAQVLEKR